MNTKNKDITLHKILINIASRIANKTGIIYKITEYNLANCMMRNISENKINNLKFDLLLKCQD